MIQSSRTQQSLLNECLSVSSKQFLGSLDGSEILRRRQILVIIRKRTTWAFAGRAWRHHAAADHQILQTLHRRLQCANSLQPAERDWSLLSRYGPVDRRLVRLSVSGRNEWAQQTANLRQVTPDRLQSGSLVNGTFPFIDDLSCRPCECGNLIFQVSRIALKFFARLPSFFYVRRNRTLHLFLNVLHAFLSVRENLVVESCQYYSG